MALFLSGFFFGGAVDHGILAVMGRSVTPYGFTLRVFGNWALGGLDLLIAAACYWADVRKAAPKRHTT